MLRSRRLLRSNPLTIDGSSSGSPPAAFGPFRVLHQVGAGTTGVVFRAHDPAEGRLVAIKAFRLDLTPEQVAELARALDALAERGLSHPSIAAPIGAGVEDGIAWFAQAYAPAESLDSALRQYGPPPVSDALTIVTQLAGALDFAAAAGVVHGSLHPRDVLVAPGETHLVDLGVAAALESCGARAPVRRPYSAPERGAGRPISRAGDIFALGAIAFELLSGQPVTGAGDDGLVTLPDVPGADREALLETFSFALALAPDERYATALAFAAPLKHALGDALTRPSAPRKRRTPRPTGALLPMDDPEPDTLPASSPGVPLADRASPHPRYDLKGEFALGSSDSDPTHDAAPSYFSGPTEPEPSAPAIEPIAAPGQADPIAAATRDRYASVEDDEDTVSSSDAMQWNAGVEPVARWDMPPEVPRDGAARVVVRDEDPPDGRRFGVHDALDYPLGDNPNYAPDRHAPYEPPAGDYAGSDYAATPDGDTRTSRAPWLAFAALLLVGIVAGLAGGWFLFSGRGDHPAPSETAASASDSTPSGNRPSGDTPSGSTTSGAAVRPREWTDDAVRPTGAAAQPGTPPPSAAASASRPSPEPRPSDAASARATAPSVETAPRGRVIVRTRPAGARVEVGGRNRGESPATLTDLPYGRHTVRVSRSGYATEQLRVTLSERRPTATVDVTLRRNAAPAAAASVGAARQAGGFVGTLVVESRPAGAKVFLDGRGVGVTPLTLSDVSVGSHVVRLDLAGHQRWSTSIRVVAGERERVAASLEEEAPR
jgi:serine/threonine protein kinase